MVLKSQRGSFMVTWQMVCDSYRCRLVQAQLNHTSRCVFADDTMKLRTKKNKSMNYGYSRAKVFFSDIDIPAFGAPKRRKKDVWHVKGSYCFCLICLHLKLQAKTSYMDFSKPWAAQWFGDENHQTEPWSAAHSLSGQNGKIKYPASASVCKLFPQSHIWFISFPS